MGLIRSYIFINIYLHGIFYTLGMFDEVDHEIFLFIVFVAFFFSFVFVICYTASGLFSLTSCFQ